MAMTPRQTEIIKSSAGVLSEHGMTVVTRFYRRLFEHHPELRSLFNHANQRSGGQSEALAHAVWAYASNIDSLAALAPAVRRISQKHASLGVQPEHYPIVGKHLLAAMSETLGDAFDEETHDAWAAAYQQLADIMIGAERICTISVRRNPVAGSVGATSRSCARLTKARRFHRSI